MKPYLFAASLFALIFSSPAYAQQLSDDELRQRLAVLDWFGACAFPFPDPTPDVFPEIGYSIPNPDPLVRENPDGGYAGTGKICFDDGACTTSCFVYTPGFERDMLVSDVHGFLLEKFKDVKAWPDGEDIYWNFQTEDEIQGLAIVSPKSVGSYAGHTLIAILKR